MAMSREHLVELGIPADAEVETWDDVIDKTRKLGAKIVSYCRGKPVNEVFDNLVVIPRGGYYVANILSRVFGHPSTDLLHLSLSSYEKGETESGSEFKYGQMPTFAETRDKNLLVIDEVCDSGKTLEEASHRLYGQAAASVKTGVLHYKPHKSQTGFVPDFYVAETDKWVVYPWEPYELMGIRALEEEVEGSVFRNTENT